MNASLKFVSGFAAALVFAAAQAAPPTVSPEQMELDPDITAKILKEKAKRNPGAMQAGNSGGGSGSGNCGSVNINSSDPKDKKSSGGIKEMMGNKSTTVVLGPVINMANCK
jgi:hypothetical protein